MSFLQTSFKTGYITDLILPPTPEGKTLADVYNAGVEVALSMAQTPEQMSALNPFVYSVKTMAPTDPHAVDASALAAHFAVDLDAPYAAGSFVHYEIKDKVPVALGYSADLTYYSAIRRTSEGIEALTNPGSGVLLHGRWMIKAGMGDGAGNEGRIGNVAVDAPDGTVDANASAHTQTGTGIATGTDGRVINLLETNTISCSVLVAWFIRASMDKAHRTAHQRFKDLWTQKMGERGFPST
ncbi:hypothetical protein A1O3_04938 [Capronia epimyces CBS 606.96]|uniref:DUF7053 domain-containing protein n=1 Tax=Capronia epimyces CBS 606.96 TaxID=1182542 RepID=W9Y4W8_9EURO|nr:uncharacterized protein A1O3_04938 [Capronia epimyces CBS 606.96]EXJ84271.1 hypothetical protein A1O3_04938 [Capronia epimyces CBS 606.96]